MDLINFLKLFVITDLADIPAAMVSVGGAVFAIIEFCDWVIITYRKRDPISEDTKRQMAGGLAFGLPLLAYFLLGYLEGTEYNLNGIFLAGGFGFVAAKASHDLFGRYTAKVTGAEKANARIEAREHTTNQPHDTTE
jgi:hypothetical protein